VHKLKLEEVTHFLSGLLLNTKTHKICHLRFSLPIDKDCFSKRVDYFSKVLDTPLSLLLLRFNFAGYNPSEKTLERVCLEHLNCELLESGINAVTEVSNRQIFYPEIQKVLLY
jgi:hypothetical protein